MGASRMIRIPIKALVVAVVCVILLIMVLPFTMSGAAVLPESRLLSLTGEEGVHLLQTLLSPPSMAQNASDQNSATLLRAFRYWLEGLLLFVPVYIFLVYKAHGVSYHFRQAVACTSLISLSIGGHAPPHHA